MKQIIYPGSFDPITNGHIDVIKRLKINYDQVIVLIAESNQKKPLFKVKERTELIQEIFKKDKSVVIDNWSGLLVDYCEKKKCYLVAKGLRNAKDFEYELTMAQTNRILNTKVETLFIPTQPELAFVSSTLVKEISSFKGNISKFVPKNVVRAIQQKIK